MTELIRGLAEAGAEVRVVTLPGSVDIDLPPNVVLCPVTIREDNYLRRALRFRAEVARILAHTGSDVVHVRGVFEGEAGLAHALVAKIPFVFEVNGLPSVELPYHHPSVAGALEFQGKLRSAEAYLLRNAAMVVTQSQTTLSFLRGRGLDEGEGLVVPNGADPSMFVEEGPPPSAELRLLYAGTLASWQGTAELLMAIRRCRRTHAVRLTMAGPVRRRWQRVLERHLRRLHIEDAVTLAGAMDRASLARLTLSSDVCVAPLRKDLRNGSQGCSPIKLFEYMAAGRAIIATDLPCVREIIDDDRTGHLVGSSRPALLADAIAEMAGDPDRRLRLGRDARAFIAQSATWDHRREALRQGYARLLSARA